MDSPQTPKPPSVVRQPATRDTNQAQEPVANQVPMFTRWLDPP